MSPAPGCGNVTRPRYRSSVAVAFDADLQLLSTAEGGRETSLRSGYRSVARLGPDDDAALWGVEITFDAPDELRPGEAASVHVSAWAWPDDDPPPPAGTAFGVYEGARLVGRAVVG